VVEISKNVFFADAVSETLANSTLKTAQTGDVVNLERALQLSDRLGGHLVQGHVDGIGTIKKIFVGPSGGLLDIKIPEALKNYAIAKGSIAIDGVSLTIAEKDETSLRIAIIPHTFATTIFQQNKSSDSVNIEVDFFAKYIEQFLSQTSKKEITVEWLKQQGF
jgi:riboflavin synthase